MFTTATWPPKPIFLVTIACFLVLAVAAYRVFAIRHTELIYKQTPQGSLSAHIFQPPHGSPVNGAVLFLHGGGWWVGSKRQFVPFSRALARQGFVALTVDYRVHGRHGTGIQYALDDAVSAWRWLAQQATRFGYEGKPLALGGGSAGGHLAAYIATDAEHIGARTPDALLLMNPVLDLMSASNAAGFSNGELGLIAELDTKARANLSPLQRVHTLYTPTLIAFGSEDPLYMAYQNELTALDSELFRQLLFTGQRHGFFNQKKFLKEIVQEMLVTLKEMNEKSPGRLADL